MVSASKEKYLFEIYLNLNEDGYTRVSQLAKSLQVSVPSVSKMVKKLSEDDYIEFQRYGIISLTEKGKKICERLFGYREVVVRFLRQINVEEKRIEEEATNITFNALIAIHPLQNL